jgi:hypothetical protein
MHKIAVVSVALLAGCASMSSEEYVASRSSWDVCRLTMGGPHSRNAEVEAQRRGLNCAPLYEAISADEASRRAAAMQILQNRQRAPQPAAYQMQVPQQTNCTSRMIAGTVHTRCD